MHEHRSFRGILHHGNQPGNLFVPGRKYSREALFHIAHAGILNLFLLPGQMERAAAEIDYRPNAQLGEILEAFRAGLAAAIYIRVHLVKIRRTRHINGARQARGQQTNGSKADSTHGREP